jgi:hypothetical protein
MSIAMNMVGGGGGKLKNTDAILTVTAPTGSTVTATKSGLTLLPTMWVQAADNTFDYALFIIKPSLFDSVNPWTVTATLGASSTSRTVTIDSNKQYDIALAYILWLFDGGAVSPYTFSKGAGKTFTVSSTIYIEADVGSQTWGTASPAVNLSGYSTLKMNVSAIGTDKDGRDKLYISTTQSASMAASVGATNTGEFSLNVSSYSGDYYIGLFTNNNGNFTVNKIWLEG